MKHLLPIGMLAISCIAAAHGAEEDRERMVTEVVKINGSLFWSYGCYCGVEGIGSGEAKDYIDVLSACLLIFDNLHMNHKVFSDSTDWVSETCKALLQLKNASGPTLVDENKWYTVSLNYDSSGPRCCQILNCCSQRLKLALCFANTTRYKYTYDGDAIECYMANKALWCETKVCNCDRFYTVCLLDSHGLFNKDFIPLGRRDCAVAAPPECAKDLL